MVLNNLILAAILALLCGAAVFGLVRVAQTYVRHRDQRVVTCYETQKPAAVHVNAAQAERIAMTEKQYIRLDQSSRWPKKRNCGQECLSQVQADPENCLVWNGVAAWYPGKTCVYCQPCAEIHRHDRPPALLSPERVAKQWNEIPAEKLPEVFQTRLPVCWNCYIAETFRRQNADGVVNRSWERVRAERTFLKKKAPNPEKHCRVPKSRASRFDADLRGAQLSRPRRCLRLLYSFALHSDHGEVIKSTARDWRRPWPRTTNTTRIKKRYR